MIDREVLKELGVATMGHALAILELAKEQSLTSDCYMKAPTVKIPQLQSGMTSQQFRKFRIDWEDEKNALCTDQHLLIQLRR